MLQEFFYEAPGTRDALFDVLKERGSGTRLLAGGTDLLVDIRAGLASPLLVVDIKKIREYHEISYGQKEGLSIGAAVRCSDVLRNNDIRERFPLIAEAAGQIGSPQIRNRATVVGNICTASPSADMAPVLLCLDASVEISSKKGSRVVPLKNFFAGVKKTALQSGEVVERITVPPAMAGAKGGIAKLKRIKGHDLALVSVALVKKGELMRVAIGACAPTPVLLKDFKAGASFEEVKSAAEKSIKPIDDVRASADYRLFMVGIYIRRLMEKI